MTSDVSNIRQTETTTPSLQVNQPNMKTSPQKWAHTLWPNSVFVCLFVCLIFAMHQQDVGSTSLWLWMWRTAWRGAGCLLLSSLKVSKGWDHSDQQAQQQCEWVTLSWSLLVGGLPSTVGALIWCGKEKKKRKNQVSRMEAQWSGCLIPERCFFYCRPPHVFISNLPWELGKGPVVDIWLSLQFSSKRDINQSVYLQYKWFVFIPLER